MFPNPTNNTVFVDAGEMSGDYTLQIMDNAGRIVSTAKGTLSNTVLKQDVSNYAAGLYTLKLTTAKHVATSKLMVN